MLTADCTLWLQSWESDLFMCTRRFQVGAAIAVASLSIALATSAKAATNLVQNPGFELGTGNGWSNNPGWGVGPGGYGLVPEDGNLIATNGCSPNPTLPCEISQVLPTLTGQTYKLTFGFNPGAGEDQFAGYDYVRLQVEWDGVVIDDLGGGPLGWTDHTITGLVASSDATSLTFRGYAAVMSGIDNVSVTESSAAIPEPASWALMITGFGLAGAVLRQRRTTTVC